MGQMEKNTILIFHESFATYARKEREFPADLYELSQGFTRLRMIHDYSTAICPLALDIEKYILCKYIYIIRKYLKFTQFIYISSVQSLSRV